MSCSLFSIFIIFIPEIKEKAEVGRYVISKKETVLTPAGEI